MRRLLLLSLWFLHASLLGAAEPVVLQLKGPHSFQFAGYYAAAAKGFYRAAGLEVETRAGKPGQDVVNEVVSGRAQFGVGASNLLLYRHAGKPVVVLAVILQHSPYVLLGRSGDDMRGVRDLAGKRLMLEPAASEIRAYLKREGVPPEQLKLLKHSFDIADFIQGKTDAFTAHTIGQHYELQQAKIPYREFSPREAGIDFYGDNLFTSEAQLRDHPDRVEAFRQASIKGWEYALAHPDEIIERILADYPQPLSRAYLAFQASQMHELAHDDVIPIGFTYPDRWHHIAEIYAELGMLPADLSLDGFLYQAGAEADYRWLALAGLLLALVGGIALYIYRTNQRLQSSLVALGSANAKLRLFQEAIEYSPASMMMVDASNRIEYVNRHFCQMTGFSAEEAVGAEPSILRSDENPPELYRQIQETLARGEIWRGELKDRHHSGEPYCVDVQIAPVKNDRGEVSHYVYVKQDINRRKQAEARLRLFQEAIENSPTSMMMVDAHNRIEYVNRHFCQMSGFSDAELIGADPAILRSNENPPELYRQIRETIERGETWRGELIDRHHSGKPYWVDLQIAPVRNDRGEVSHYVVVKQDIDGRKQAETRLQESESLFRSLVESANDLIYSHDPEGVMTYVSPNIRENLGYDPDEIVGQPFDGYIHPEDLPAALEFTERALVQKTKNSGLVYRILHKDGGWRWHTTNEAPLFDAKGQVTGLIGITRDISELIELQQQLEHQARFDFLTGLHNRRYFMELANQEFFRCKRYQKPLALMMLDIDHFKHINDTHGHQAGDLALVSLAQVCRAVLREVDEIGRIGGEEFAILLPETNAQSGMEAAERLRRALEEATVPIDPPGMELRFTVSIGVSTLPPGSTLENLLQTADAALYQAKRSGRNRVVLSADS